MNEWLLGEPQRTYLQRLGVEDRINRKRPRPVTVPNEPYWRGIRDRYLQYLHGYVTHHVLCDCPLERTR